jgi:5,10-methylenetetrahydrofolate reductase
VTDDAPQVLASQLNMKTNSTADRVFSQLCADVDYWRARAERAEHELQFEREQQIHAAGLWDNYSGMLRVFGGKPAEDRRPQS